MSFEITPAIDIKEGKCVQLVEGRPGTGSEYGDPVEMASEWVERGANRLHIIDLDGAIKGDQSNLNLIKKIINSVDKPIQVGGGIRNPQKVRELGELDVDRLIIGSAAFNNPDFIEEAKKELKETKTSLFICLDSRDNEVMIEGWKESAGVSVTRAVDFFQEKEVDGFLLTDIAKEGKLEGIDIEWIRSVSKKVDKKLIVSGGISSLSDLISLRDAGIEEVVVGTALYEGKINLKEAKNALGD
ncbi:MAG: Phosphoribosylformimino-5-aminoimidazole carboxamide ribonucleotide HisA [Candidatus Methanohalarchaeum thermophilum]|uniref:1-(5-phosphoribosyl)-5-[(5-phosphoribosylamino)methylideneamino] imidazole-4-carboxamide isomerase n=1 Tax=Methanohalarchaeum thermophilum TaxID=1903181 RepID=A0A1Q6DXV3_METT1|nr:MAG: Phosphoribosylformimino-5-aminoimidazole carboxamide ribonucleotide HisA [Candidatus Methanohalarchaeum thermophilum]